MSKLKSCQYCGSEKLDHFFVPRGNSLVYCTECHARGPVALTADAAEAAWNKRVYKWEEVPFKDLYDAFIMLVVVYGTELIGECLKKMKEVGGPLMNGIEEWAKRSARPEEEELWKSRCKKQKGICPICKGVGYSGPDGDMAEARTCAACNGTGGEV